MDRNRLTPLAAVAAVVIAVVAVVAGVSLLSRDSGATEPPVLRLAAGGQDSHAAYGTLSSAGTDPRGAYRLIGALPNGPSEARIRDLPVKAAPSDRVSDLAAALGETATPKRVDGTWKAGDLVVSDQPGNPWTFGKVCPPDTPVSSDGGVANDPVAPVCAGGTVTSGGGTSGAGTSGGGSSGGGSSGAGSSGTGTAGTIEPDTTSGVSPGSPSTGTSGGSPGSPGTSPSVTGSSNPGSDGTVDVCPSPPPGAEPIVCVGPMIPVPGLRPSAKALLTDSQALAATARVREALSLADAPTRVEGLTVVVEPLADRVPTHGIPTVLRLSNEAGLVSASGSLAIGEPGDSYPLRTAREAFDALPVIAMGAPCDVVTGCPEPPAITGARLGLSLVALEKGTAALVPAWLFTVQDSPVPLVALAVADQFLGLPEPTQPDPEPTQPGIEPGTPPSTKPGTEPGIEPGPDGSLPTSPPDADKPADPSAREPFAFDGAYADADPTVLVVRYGDSGSCPSLAVRHSVVQEPDRVIVTLTRTPMPTDRACTMDYRPHLVRVTLTAQLGSREIIDGSQKETVPISTGTPPSG